MELVDILEPPTFEKTGVVKDLEQAWENGDWIGTFNLWILQNTPSPALVYQVRSPNSSWAPGKLDVTAGGHYEAGEVLFDGLREIEEELGKQYNPEDLTYLGRKINVSPDTKGRMRNNIVDVSFVTDNASLNSYVLQQSEVYAICSCSIADLLKVHTSDHTFTAELLKTGGDTETVLVTRESFPYNWDNYHFKIALLADRFLRGEESLLY